AKRRFLSHGPSPLPSAPFVDWDSFWQPSDHLGKRLGSRRSRGRPTSFCLRSSKDEVGKGKAPFEGLPRTPLRSSKGRRKRSTRCSSEAPGLDPPVGFERSGPPSP